MTARISENNGEKRNMRHVLLLNTVTALHVLCHRWFDTFCHTSLFIDFDYGKRKNKAHTHRNTFARSANHKWN